MDAIIHEIELRMIPRPELISVPVQAPDIDEEEMMKKRLMEEMSQKRLLYLRKTPKDVFVEKIMKDNRVSYDEAEDRYLDTVEKRL
jgi:hypothetical protein